MSRCVSRKLGYVVHFSINYVCQNSTFPLNRSLHRQSRGLRNAFRPRDGISAAAPPAAAAPSAAAAEVGAPRRVRRIGLPRAPARGEARRGRGALCRGIICDQRDCRGRHAADTDETLGGTHGKQGRRLDARGRARSEHHQRSATHPPTRVTLAMHRPGIQPVALSHLSPSTPGRYPQATWLASRGCARSRSVRTATHPEPRQAPARPPTPRLRRESSTPRCTSSPTRGATCPPRLCRRASCGPLPAPTRSRCACCWASPTTRTRATPRPTWRTIARGCNDSSHTLPTSPSESIGPHI